MAEEHILKQINLLNTKVKNKEVADIEISEATTSEGLPYNALQFSNNFNNQNNTNDIFNNQINEEDSDVLNLWSQTNFFFDPVDPSKIDAVQQQQQQQQQNNINTQITEIHDNNGNGGENNDEILQLSERERDRQRYNKLKERIFSHKTKHPKENNNNTGIIDKNALIKEDFLDFHGLQRLMDSSNSNKSDFQLDNNILKLNTTVTNPNFSTVASSSSTSYSNNNIPSLNDKSKTSRNKGGKSNNLYTQILNSINSNTGIHSTKELNSSSLLSKTNDSRSKEIADKKKRRSAATMRCREKKRNQFQKKEQYINYLKNHVLFLDGLISHIGNEINWLRKSYITQHGEQSLKEVYIENGLKNVDFSVFPGSVSLTSSSLLVNPLNQEVNLKPPPPSLPLSSTLSLNSPNIMPAPSLQINKQDDTSKLSNIPFNVNSPSLEQSSLDLNINSNPYNTVSLSALAAATATATTKEVIPTPTIPPPSIPPPSTATNDTTNTNTTTTTTTKSLDSSQNMSFLNGFLNLSKEQRDLLINFLKKQDQVQKPTTSSTSNSFVNLSSSNITASDPPPNFSSKPNSLLGSIQNAAPVTTTSESQLSSLQQNLLNTLNQHSTLSSLYFNNSSMAAVASHSTESAQPSTTDLSNPITPSTINTTNTNTTTEPTTTTTSIKNLDKVIYYI
ncbi:hypothetical protein PIROE2DRAFT_58390 [Piromyces sp. E2]|nr:hypothetical protein PIROE2DRAFT_58390 [Piromyces sp. E2]|eukprot:OUM67994.1 hypothetical protein PIROE2DRAFT_58390 [Piromyces sp. E2]